MSNTYKVQIFFYEPIQIGFGDLLELFCDAFEENGMTNSRKPRVDGYPQTGTAAFHYIFPNQFTVKLTITYNGRMNLSGAIVFDITRVYQNTVTDEMLAKASYDFLLKLRDTPATQGGIYVAGTKTNNNEDILWPEFEKYVPLNRFF